MSTVTPRKLVAALASSALVAGGLSLQPLTASAYDSTPIPQTDMTVVNSNSESVNEGTNGAAALVLDGNDQTYWHTEWSPEAVAFPHHITVQVADAPVTIGRVHLTPRMSSNGSGRVNEYRLSTASGDCSTATYAVQATGSFPGDLASRTEVRTITMATPVEANCVKLEYLSAWGGASSGDTSPVGVASSLAEFNVDVASGDAPVGPTPDPVVPVIPEGAVELADGDFRVRLHPDFPQVVDYRLGEEQLAGRLGAPLTSVLVNEVEQPVTVAAPVVAADGRSATYSLTFPELEGVSMDALVSVEGQTMKFTLTNLEDAAMAVNRVRIPNHNLVTVTSDDPAAQLTAGMMHVDRNASADRFEALATANAGSVQGSWMVVANDSGLAAGFDTNATEDNTAGGISAGRVRAQNNRYQRQITTQGDVKHGAVWAGTWTWLGAAAEQYIDEGPAPIGHDDDPYVEVTVTADRNADDVVDWQDGAVATRDIVELGLGADDVKNQVVSRIPFNIVSQATHPFLRTLDDTKRISLATDNLAQKVLLKGYQSEGHDAAHPDYAGHYNERAGGLEDLEVLVNEGLNWNSTFGVHVNATESYSEAHHFTEDLLRMPPQAAWGWMNQSYYIDGPKDLGRGNVLERFQQFRDEVPANLSWLYIDVYWPYGWEMERLASELTEQGWGLASEWSDRFPSQTIWSHWSQEENYGGTSNKGVNSQLIRFVYNDTLDTWNPHPILSNSNLVDFEGWTGHNNYNGFITNVWQRNLPVKFLQQSPITRWETNRIEFANGTVATSPLTTIGGSVVPTDRVFTYDGATVYEDGVYLLPWTDGGSDRLYHYNIGGGETTWTLTDAWQSQTSLTLFKLTDTGREKVADVTPVGGEITLNAESGVAYVLHPTSSVPPVKDPNWGQASDIEDPGFFSGTLDAYDVEGNVTVDYNSRRNYEANFGAGAGRLSQTLDLPAGDYSAWAWVEIEPGQVRPLTIEATGTGVTPFNYAEGEAGRVYNTISSSPVLNATASDQKLRTNFQRLRVTFTSTGQPVTLSFVVPDGSARVSIDDLRVVAYGGAEDAEPTAQTVFFEDFENIDTGYYPFVTGRTNAGGDARSQLAEKNRHGLDLYGWWGLNPETGAREENGKAMDNVIDGQWSLMMNNENNGEILKTANGAIPFKAGHSYRVSFDYQTTMADKYQVRIGHDTPAGGTFETTNLVTEPLGRQYPTSTFTTEFEAATCDPYFIAIDKLTGPNHQNNMTMDNLRVEDLGRTADVACLVPSISVEGGATAYGGQVRTVTTTLTSLGDAATGVAHELVVPEGWEAELVDAGATAIAPGAASTATWVVRIPREVTSTTLTIKGTGIIDGDAVERSASTDLVVIAANDTYLSDMRDQVTGTPVNGWGPVEWDSANGESAAGDGTPLKLKGETYAKGIGVHAASNVKFNVAGECTGFSALVGIDDSRGANGSVQFQVFGDGQPLGEMTPVLRGGSDPIALNVDITGVEVLELRVTDGGNGNGSDHGNWALARVACGEAAPIEVAPVVTAPGTAEPGATVTLQLRGFAPTAGSSIAEVYVDGVRVGTAEISEDGTGTATVTLPGVGGDVTIEVRQWGAGIDATTYPAVQQTISVDGSVINRAPVVTAIANVTGTVGKAVSVRVSASDPEGGALTYSATGLPAGVTINPATGLISGTPTARGTYTVTVSVRDAGGQATTRSFVMTVVTAPAPKYVRTAPYTLPGDHTVGDRQWRTTCEPYSQTERCRAEIWASVVKRSGNVYTIERGWAFNNLTYLPFMEREQWKTNPLGGFGQYRYADTFTGTDGQQWRVECDSAASGRNGCRAYRMTTVYYAEARPGGGYTFGQKNQWVFNNIVLFGNYSR